MNFGDRDPQRLSALHSRAVGGVWRPHAVRLMHRPGRLLVVGADSAVADSAVLPKPTLRARVLSFNGNCLCLRLKYTKCELIHQPLDRRG